ncbi:uncharacterized protein LOC111344613 [Stylophora pistillata]|uniref:uncharacterized protein LOC111344613 n=1 Tax=Stylophora pistillata TaxID=50429 RepID=UPI000C04CE5E|nr:uncharacterized protein LOC111344613 [Stylophora pistillata]
MSLEGSMRNYLESVGLREICLKMESHGFNQISDILSMDDEDLAVAIPDEESKMKFKTVLHQDVRLVKIWLDSLGLGQYYDQFQASGLKSLARCSGLSLRSLDSVVFNLPGHKKRVFREAQSLLGYGTVVAEGAWEEHEQLRGGKFGKFLCLTADIFARDPQETRNNPNEGAAAVPHRRVKFMVDSGSDMVTLHYDIIKELQLPVKGCAKQEVPGGQTRELPLYSACLGIGRKMLNIQIVPDSVSTVGTPVLWEFRHRIDGEKHVWLAKAGEFDIKP